MKLEIKLEEPSSIQRRLIVSVPPEAFEATYQTHLKDVQKKAKLKGFRQGHVPLPMVQKMYGADLNQRVLQDLVDQSYSQALKEKGLRPVSRPTIEASEKDGRLLKENKELNYVATFEVLPEITLKKYKNLSLEKQKLDIKEKDIDEVLKQLQDSRAQMEPISEDTQASRKVKKGDYVDLDFDGGLVTENGVEPYPGMKGSRPLEIGSNSLIPGFEDEVVGLRWGEEKTFKITFPKDRKSVV